MKAYPQIPTLADATPDLFEKGHLWMYEWVAGVQCRFQLTEYGTLRIGDRHRSYDAADVPLSHRHVVGYLRDHLDRAALRTAVESVDDIVFVGRATIQQGVPYEWARLPSFLGLDIWHGGRDRFLPPGTVQNIYRRLDLDPLDTVAKEVNVRDFDPDAVTFPPSGWYDGPAAGVLIENKRGGSARKANPAVKTPERAPLTADSPSALAAHLTTDDRLSRAVERLERHDRPVTVETVHERLFETVVREEYLRLVADGPPVDVDAVRSALGDLVSEYLYA